MMSSADQCRALDPFHLHSRVGVHRGDASLVVDGVPICGAAEFLLPVEGSPIGALRCEKSFAGTPASDVQVVGMFEGRPFTLVFRMGQLHRTFAGTHQGWSLLSPKNGPVRIDYADAGPITGARFVLNNFDYEDGDPVEINGGFTRVGTPLTVQLDGGTAVFRRLGNYDAVKPLVLSGLLRSASLVEIECQISDADDEPLLALANDIASVCTFARGASVTVAMVELTDCTGRVARRLVPQPVESRFRDRPIVPDINIPRLFEETFSEHVRMRRSSLPWRKLAGYCGSLEDSPYLEQKLASLMAAVEFFMRTSLREDGMGEKEVKAMDLSDLIGQTRRRLAWRTPSHYTARDATRRVRNAVAHGDEMPLSDSTELRLLFDKWHLFLYRRVLMRLGYKGEIRAPRLGYYEWSDVADFTEQRNSFRTDDADKHPWAQWAARRRQVTQARSPHSRVASTEGDTDQ